MLMRAVVVAFGVLLAVPALAEEPLKASQLDPHQVEHLKAQMQMQKPTANELDALQSLGVMARAFDRVVEDGAKMRIQIAAMQQHQADLDRYLMDCGDKPGCTQPIAEK